MQNIGNEQTTSAATLSTPSSERKPLSLASRNLGLFCLVLCGLLLVFFNKGIIFGHSLASVDILLLKKAVNEKGIAPEPKHRLLSDPVYQFIPWREYGYKSLWRGRVPYLDMNAYCGAPFYANFQAMLFCPTRALASPGDSPRFTALCHALELFLAGLGMYLFAMSIDLRESARWLGGLAWALSGYLVVWKLWPHSATAYPLTWIFFGLMLFHRGRIPLAIATTVSAVFLSWLGGHPETTCHMLLGAGVFALYLVFRGEHAERRDNFLASFKWGLAVILAFALAAFVLVPSMYYLFHSYAWEVRGGGGPVFWKLSNTNLLNVPGFFFPYIYGSRFAGSLPLDAFLHTMNTNELAGGYVCWAVPLVMLPLAVARRKLIKDFTFWIIAFIVCVEIYAGLPIVSKIFSSIPVIGASAAARFNMLAGFAALVLAMKVVDSLQSNPFTSGQKKLFAIILCVVALGAFSTAAMFRMARPKIEKKIESRMSGQSESLSSNPVFSGETSEGLTHRLEKTTVRYPIWIGISACLVLGGFMFACGESESKWRFTPLTAAIVIDLFVFGYGYTPAARSEDYYPASPAIEYVRDNVKDYRAAAVGEAVLPNSLAIHGIPDMRGYDAIEPLEFMQVCITCFGMQDAMPLNFRFLTQKDYSHPLADFLGLKYLISETPLEKIIGENPELKKFRKAFRQINGVLVYENTRAMPRFYFARKTVVEADRQKRLAMMKNWTSEKPAAIIEKGKGEVFAAPANAKCENITDRSITFSCDTDRDSFLTIAYVYYPGWECLIDGKPTEILRTNYAFMGVRVPAGAKRIEFAYRPEGLDTGFIVSLLALGISVFWLAISVKSSKKTAA